MDKINLGLIDIFLQMFTLWTSERKEEDWNLYTCPNPISGETMYALCARGKNPEKVMDKLEPGHKEGLQKSGLLFYETTENGKSYPNGFKPLEQFIIQQLKHRKSKLEQMAKRIEQRIQSRENFGSGKSALGKMEIQTINQNKRRISLLSKEVDSFIEDNQIRSATILGDYGEGKTYFCEQYSQVKLTAIVTNLTENSAPSIPIPILVSTGEMGQADVNELIVKNIVETMGSGTSMEDLKKLCQAGLFVLIIDGFDQMYTENNSFATREYRKIEQWCRNKGKLIFTCREEFYNVIIKEANHAFSPEHSPSENITLLLAGVEENEFKEKTSDSTMKSAIINQLSKMTNSIKRKPLFLKLICEFYNNFDKPDSKDIGTVAMLLNKAYESKISDENSKILKTILGETLRFGRSRTLSRDELEALGFREEQVKSFLSAMSFFLYGDNKAIGFRFPIFVDFFHFRYCYDEMNTEKETHTLLKDYELSIESRRFFLDPEDSPVMENSEDKHDKLENKLFGIITQSCRLKDAEICYLATNSVNIYFDIMRNSTPDRQSELREKLVNSNILEGTKIDRVDAHGLDLSRVSFAGAQLKGANFYDTILKGAAFRNTQLDNANFFSSGEIGTSALCDTDRDDLLYLYGTNTGSIFHGRISNGANLQTNQYSRFNNQRITVVRILHDKNDDIYLCGTVGQNMYTYNRTLAHWQIHPVGFRWMSCIEILSGKTLLVSSNGELRFFNPKNPKTGIITLCQLKLDPKGGMFTASVAIGDDEVLIGNSNGLVYRLKIQGDSLKIKRKTTFKIDGNDLDIDAMAFLSNNHLLVQTHGSGDMRPKMLYLPLENDKWAEETEIKYVKGKDKSPTPSPTCISASPTGKVFFGEENTVFWGELDGENLKIENKISIDFTPSTIDCSADGNFFTVGGEGLKIYNIARREKPIHVIHFFNCEDAVFSGARGLSAPQLCFLLSHGAILPEPESLRNLLDDEGIRMLTQTPGQFECHTCRTSHPMSKLDRIKAGKPSCNL